MSRVLEQVRLFLSGLDPQQRFNLVAAVVASAVAISAVWIWSAQVPYRTVLSNRDPAEVMEAVKVLGEAGITVKMQDDGSISVPEVEHAKALSAMTGARVYPEMEDILDISAGVSFAQLQEGLRRQLRGELEQILEQMDGVSRARVFVSVPDKVASLFDKSPPSTSIQLIPYPGQRITKEIAEGARAVVAGAVGGGLKPDAIPVTTPSGTIFDGSDESDVLSSTDLMEIEESRATRLKDEVTRFLERMIGDTSKFAVSVQVQVSRETQQIEERQIDVESPALMRSRTLGQSSENSRPGGVPGTDASLPERAKQEAKQTETNEEEQEESEFSYPRKVISTLRPAGELVNQSVSVTVDKAVVEAQAAAADLSPDQMRQRIEEMLATAIQLDEARGDQLRVSTFAFAAAPAIEERPVAMMSQVSPYLPYAIQLLALGLAFVLMRPLIAAVTRAPKLKVVSAATEGEQEAEEDDLTHRVRGMVREFERVDAGELNALVGDEAQASSRVIELWSKGA